MHVRVAAARLPGRRLDCGSLAVRSSPRRRRSAPWLRRAEAGGALLALVLCVRAPERAAAELRRARMIGPGVKHVVIYRNTGPCVAHVVEVDTSQPYIQLRTTLPMRPRIGALRLSAQAARLTAPGQYPIAGINGDYFIEERGPFRGLPIGAAISQGEIVHSPYPRSALVVDR